VKIVIETVTEPTLPSHYVNESHSQSQSSSDKFTNRITATSYGLIEKNGIRVKYSEIVFMLFVPGNTSVQVPTRARRTNESRRGAEHNDRANIKYQTAKVANVHQIETATRVGGPHEESQEGRKKAGTSGTPSQSGLNLEAQKQRPDPQKVSQGSKEFRDRSVRRCIKSHG
jgi:hypothetical protein